MKPLLLAPLLLVLAPLPFPAFAAELSVTDAFARATPGSGPGGAYLTIRGGDEPDRLLSAASPTAAKVVLHSMTTENNVMRMREVEGIDVPAGGTVQLRPGGFHLMLEGLRAPLKAGETVPLTLRFARAGERVLAVPVGSPAQAAPPHH